MENKEKLLYAGIGAVAGFIIGVISFSNVRLTNVGHIEHLTINCAEETVDEEDND